MTTRLRLAVLILTVVVTLMMPPFVTMAAQDSATAMADEAAALLAVEKLGGKVTRDVELPGMPVVAVNLFGADVTNAALKEFKDLTCLRTLNLDDTRVTDEGLQYLKDLPCLRTLYLAGTRVTNHGLKELKNCQSLRKLDLSATQVTDEGLQELQDLTDLAELDLSFTKVTDTGVEELLCALPDLKIERKTQVDPILRLPQRLRGNGWPAFPPRGGFGPDDPLLKPPKLPTYQPPIMPTYQPLSAPPEQAELPSWVWVMAAGLFFVSLVFGIFHGRYGPAS
jgi:hypothetical protein